MSSVLAGRGISRLSTTAIWIVLAALCVMALTWLAAEVRDGLVAVQVVVSCFLLTLAIIFDFRRDVALTPLMRPAYVVAASIVIGAVAAPQLSQDEYKSYLSLWLVFVAGAVFGLLVTQQTKVVPEAGLSLNVRRLAAISIVLFTLSVMAALVFFAAKGVPALGGDVEEARVTVASSGTGYFRLLAYLGIPAVQMLVAIRHKLAFVALLIEAAVILGLADRSPLLFLFVPILVVLHAQGRIRLSMGRILLAATVALCAILAVGTFRIVSQQDFASYQEYKTDLATGNYLGVALTSLDHYAAVVPDNAVLTKELVDSGALPHKLGSTYFTLFTTAVPGQQLSLDLQIKQASGKSFIGGGTPPTAMGEGYVNFGWAGTFLEAAVLVWILRFWATRYRKSIAGSDPNMAAVTGAVYGFMMLWVLGSPVAGLAGASTVGMSVAIVLVIMRSLCAKAERS